jgi:DUF1680 family protein
MPAVLIRSVLVICFLVAYFSVGVSPLFGPDALAFARTPKLEAVPFTAVEINDVFWSPRIRVNRKVTIPHILDMCELEGRVRNMCRAAGELDGPFEGTRHHDADLFKAIEAAAYSLARHPDEALSQRLKRIIDAVAAAQQEDGYLHSYVSTVRPGQRSRRNLQLFATGHLIDAAVAYYQATGSLRLLDVACRFADLIDSIVGPHAACGVSGHPKIEASLVRLSRVTGKKRYLVLARSFVDERGYGKTQSGSGQSVHRQDHQPVREQKEAVGHVICALFLYEGMYDVGMATTDAQLIAASKRLWRDAVQRKMYITGAMGRSSDERFTEAYALDDRSSIGEGCQSAGLVRLSHRLLLDEADSRYADVIERVFYNNLPAAVSLDGRRFYYVNRLSVRPKDATGQPYVHPLTATTRGQLPRFCLDRQPWFKVPCCPPNVAMTIATLGQYVYSKSDTAIYVNLYLGNRVTTTVAGTEVCLTQQTRYPWDGTVSMNVMPAEPNEFDIFLRVPDWCRCLESTGGLYRPDRACRGDDWSIEVNGQPVSKERLEKGYVPLRRRWHKGDQVSIRLPMPAMLVTSDPRVTCNTGRVALQRGPLVYCIEAAEHDSRVRDIRLRRETELVAEHRPDLLGGVTVLRGRAVRIDEDAGKCRPVPLLAIPYACWCNRKPGEMDVWLQAVE